MLVDIGVNLTNSQFDKDRPAVVERAQRRDDDADHHRNQCIIESEHATESGRDPEATCSTAVYIHTMPKTTICRHHKESAKSPKNQGCCYWRVWSGF